MKAAPLILCAALAALVLPSCSAPATGYPAAGYSPRDAYRRGHVDGSGDRLGHRSYDPHINEDRSLPRAHRQDYLWGYIDGFDRPSRFGDGGK